MLSLLANTMHTVTTSMEGRDGRYYEGTHPRCYWA